MPWSLPQIWDEIGNISYSLWEKRFIIKLPRLAGAEGGGSEQNWYFTPPGAGALEAPWDALSCGGAPGTASWPSTSGISGEGRHCGVRMGICSAPEHCVVKLNVWKKKILFKSASYIKCLWLFSFPWQLLTSPSLFTRTSSWLSLLLLPFSCPTSSACFHLQAASCSHPFALSDKHITVL